MQYAVGEASELFGSPEKALGEKIKLNGDNYTVVGVVEQQTESAADFDDGCTDDFVWIPYSRAAKIARNAVISNYTFTSYDINDTEACTAALEEFLYSKMKNEDLYSVTDAAADNPWNVLQRPGWGAALNAPSGCDRTAFVKCKRDNENYYRSIFYDQAFF